MTANPNASKVRAFSISELLIAVAVIALMAVVLIFAMG